jgi:Pyruvate/2-oxoacid:ferredoxin oxidoreductase delta subunit
MVSYPNIKPELCTGCGICENKCPLESEAGIIITRESEGKF